MQRRHPKSGCNITIKSLLLSLILNRRIRLQTVASLSTILSLLILPIMIRSCSGFTIRLSRQMSRGIMHRSMLGRSMRLSIGKASLLAHDPVAEMPTLHSAALKNDTLLSLVHSDHDEDNQERNSVVNDQDEHAEVTRLVETWKAHPRLNPTVVFRSLCVKDSSQIHTIVNAPEMQDHLASRLDLLSHLHTRIKVVRDSENGDKMILLHPDAPPFQELPTFVQDACTPGSVVPIKFAYNQFTASYALLQILPSHIHPPPTAFETIGHVIHMNLRSHHFPYRYLIGQVLLESLRSHVKTVLVKVGQVTGPFRTYDFEIVAGENNTLVDVVEAGLRLQFDMAKVYWCSRLSEERQRMLNLIEKGALIADPFCGVGALCLHAAARDASCFVLANDWNPSAIEWLHKNAKSNGIDDQQIQSKCGDAYDFLMDLGLSEQHPLPDHVVMNFPLEGPKFLGALRWWPKDSDVIPRVHVYTFARPTDDLSAEELAVDIIASNLIAGLAPGAASCRRQELDECYDCNLQLHAVRDVAPGKTVYCVSFSATPQLIKAMQGDF